MRSESVGCGVWTRPVPAMGSDPRAHVPPLAPALPANRGFALSLLLGAGLLVEAALPELGVEPRSLNLPLELPESSLEALAVLHDDFQRWLPLIGPAGSDRTIGHQNTRPRGREQPV